MPTKTKKKITKKEAGSRAVKKSNVYTIKEAAEKLGVSSQTMYHWCTKQKVKCYQKDNAVWQIPINTLKRPEIPNWHFAHPDNLKNSKKKSKKTTKKVAKKK